MTTPKTTRLDIRLTPLLRSHLAQDAGPHGSLSSVARTILEDHYRRKRTKRPVRRAA